MKFKDKVVFEGFNKNLMLFTYKPNSKNEKFSFDQKKNVWYNEFTDRVMSTDHKNPLAAGANVATHEYHPDEIFHQWELVPCEDPDEEEARLQKEAADAKEELSAEEVAEGDKKEGDSKEGPSDEANKKVVEDQAKEIEKKKEKEEDGEESPPPSSSKKKKEEQEDTRKSEDEKKEDEAEAQEEKEKAGASQD